MLEIRGAAPGLLDDPLLLEVGGAAPNTRLTWRARVRDDDGFVWRATAETSEGLLTAWAAAKPSAGPVMALRSLRPVEVDVRVEDPDGAASSRTITRTLLGEGVKVRRWKGDAPGTLYLPTGEAGAALVVDARAEATDAPALALPPAAALLASRGVLVFAVAGGKGADPLGAGGELVRSLPAAPAAIRTLDALPVPPGVGGPGDAEAWDALLAELSATPRRVAR